ncbi:aspartate aminotransferase family protein [Candidatus Woesearchaeota archaeon]|nr:MAG: aspartate aminotransferase family protein [Candidatus Woesearchaeota archaeon]
MDYVPFSKRKYEPLGPKSKALIEKTKKYSATNYEPYPFVVSHSSGPWLYDVDGNRALDFLSAYSTILSHGLEEVLQAVELELRRGTDVTSRALYTEAYAEFVETLCSVTGYERVLPKSDGGSATDAALKGLLMHAGKRKISNPNIILTNEYFHGRTISFTASADFDPDQKAGMLINVPYIKVVDHDLNSIEQAIDENTIGVFVETHKGEGGPLFYGKDFFIGLRKLTHSKGIFLGADEIQTGLGRCGYIMAWQEFGEDARPDFVTLGKALGGGVMPVSAVVGKEDYMKIFKPGTDGSTFGGNPLACRAAVASLNAIISKDVPARSRELGNYFVSKLKDIKHLDIDHRGLLIRVGMKGIKTTKYACLEMLLGNRNPRVFMKAGHYNAEKDVAYTRIAPPPLAITKDLIDYALDNTVIPVLKEAVYQ